MMNKKHLLYGSTLIIAMGMLACIAMTEMPGIHNTVDKKYPLQTIKTSATYYYCYNQSDIEAAITAIDTGEGIIVLANESIILSSTIALDGGGNYTIESGIGTVIEMNGNFWPLFNISSTRACQLDDFAINASDLISFSAIVIFPSNNQVEIDNISLTGNGHDGIGINFYSDGVIIKNCNISELDTGIKSTNSRFYLIQDNEIYDCDSYGIYAAGAPALSNAYGIINGNHIHDNEQYGIKIAQQHYSTLISNTLLHNGMSNGDHGIFMTGSNHSLVLTNNCSFNQEGITLWWSYNNSIQGNNCSHNENGIMLENDASDNDIIENTCNYNTQNGIYLDNCDDNSIQDNDCIKNIHSGIYLTDSDETLIENNICLENVVGIAMETDCINNDILRNTCNNNSLSGIYLWNGINNNTIESNTCNFNNEYGIYIYNDCDDNTILNNNCSHNEVAKSDTVAGIFLRDGDRNIIQNNTCNDNKNPGSGDSVGIYLLTFSACEENSILINNCTGNAINYVNLGTDTYFKMYCEQAFQIQEALDLIASDTGKIILAPTTFTLASNININGGGNYIIEGQGDDTVIDCDGDRGAFNITNTNSCELQNFNINASLVSTERIIISINETNHNEIKVNDICITGYNKSGWGIRIYNGNTTIKGCMFNDLLCAVSMAGNGSKVMDSYFSDNYVCIYIFGLDGDSFYNQIKDNVITKSFQGIAIAGGGGSTGFNIVSGNVIKDLYYDGDYYIEAALTIYLSSTSHNNISGNYLINNVVGYDDHPVGAIWLDSSCSNNIITDNFITNSSNHFAGEKCYGIYIGGSGPCNDNLIYNNTLIGNEWQAFDSHVNNSWNNTEIGNFWGDYTGVDFDFDGIGDIPYNVSSAIFDWKPIWNSDIELLSPSVGSTVSQYPPDFSFLFHDPNINATWYSLDGGLHNYTFSGDFTINAQAWQALWEDYTDGDPITITIYFNTTHGYIVPKTFTLYGNYIYPTDYTLLIIALVIAGISFIGVAGALMIRRKIMNRPKTWSPEEDVVRGTIIDSGPAEYDEEE